MGCKHLGLVLLIGLSSCGVMAQEGSATSVKSGTEIKTFKADNGWGYDIYMNGKKYIHQTTIPSVPGTAGFVSEEDARKVGDFTVGKIEKNIMPPSVTPEELDSLGIVLPEK